MENEQKAELDRTAAELERTKLLRDLEVEEVKYSLQNINIYNFTHNNQFYILNTS